MFTVTNLKLKGAANVRRNLNGKSDMQLKHETLIRTVSNSCYITIIALPMQSKKK
jgi:hypothetical protein